MSPRSAVPAVLLVLLVAVSATAPSAFAAGSCRATGDEVRFDDGRLLVEREVRRVNPRTEVERWSACWRPSGARRRLTSFTHTPSAAGLSVAAVRRGRFVVLEGRGALDVFDGRRGGRTASMAQLGALRELVITAAGHLVVLQDTGNGARQLWGAAGAARCLLDAGAPQTAAGDVFGDVTVRGESARWHREGLGFSQDLARLAC